MSIEARFNNYIEVTDWLLYELKEAGPYYISIYLEDVNRQLSILEQDITEEVNIFIKNFMN